MRMPQRNARGLIRNIQQIVDSEEDVTGIMTQVNTKHGSKVATDVQPTAPPKPAKKKGRPCKGPKKPDQAAPEALE